MTLVNDILGCQRTDIESFRKTAKQGKGIELKRLAKNGIDEHAVCCTLTKDIELPLKVTGIDRPILARISFAVMATKYDEGLKNCRLSATSRRTKDSTISRNLTPTKDTKTKILCNFGENSLLVLQLDGIIFLEKDVSDSVLSKLWKEATDIHLHFTLE